MPDLVTDKNSSEANEKHPKKGALGSLGKYKWYVVGALAVIAVLVFYFSRKGTANNSSTASGTSQGGIDPSTGVPYASEFGAGGAYGIPGPAGPTGATGATGATGKRGKTGKQGKPGRQPKPVHVHKHKGGTGHKPGTAAVNVAHIPVIGVSSARHPALRLASAHKANTQKAVRTPKPARTHKAA